MSPHLRSWRLPLLLWLIALPQKVLSEPESPLFSRPRSEPEPILAPFRLSWGLGPEDLEEILKRSKIPITSRQQDGDTLRIEVTGVPQRNILRTIFSFEDGILCEIELQLGKPTWGAAEYNRFFLEAKRLLDARYGRGIPLILEKDTKGSMETFIAGYAWSQFGGNIRLFFFQATGPDGEVRVLSQHYRPF